MDARELSLIALERWCATARCASTGTDGLGCVDGVSHRGALVRDARPAHAGSTVSRRAGADATAGEAGEALTVVDREEAWVFHVLADDTGTSAVWAARKVPDAHVAVVANQFVITTLPPEEQGSQWLASCECEGRRDTKLDCGTAPASSIFSRCMG